MSYPSDLLLYQGWTRILYVELVLLVDGLNTNGKG
jgi:hypothetical protein